MQTSRDLDRLLEIMAALRTPGSGCPWDLVQSHTSLAPYAIEEAYEVVDSIERGDMAELRDELGDLLFQVVFHARVAEEAGAFTFGDVVEGITGKMLRRHPHVFPADGFSPTPATEVAISDRLAATNATWDTIKAQERRGKSARPAGVLADVPVTLPGLTRAVKLQKRASSVGFDWGDARLVLAKIREEIDEIDQELDAGPAEALAGEIGDLLFAVANLARHAGVDPETSVRATNAKFERRFAYIEAKLRDGGTSADRATLEDMDALWNEAKRDGL